MKAMLLTGGMGVMISNVQKEAKLQMVGHAAL